MDFSPPPPPLPDLIWRRPQYGRIRHARMLNQRITAGRGHPTYEEAAMCGFEPIVGWSTADSDHPRCRTCRDAIATS
jgi:hypothetical protein